MEICLKHLEGNKYSTIDCETGESVDLIPEGKVKTKRTRAPSQYNIHMGQCVKSKTGPIKERFSFCAAEWKKKK